MNGQAKVLIPALIGIAILLLTGISGVFQPPGEQQATFTASQAVSPGEGRREMLGAAFRSEADTAALQTSMDVAADLAIDLQTAPQQMPRQTPRRMIAKADME